MDALVNFVINAAPGMSILELKDLIKKLNVKAVVVSDALVRDSDVETLYKLMKDGYSIIVFLKMRNSYDSALSPSGHFIGLNPQSNNNIEIYDPAGDPVKTYIKRFGKWLPKLVSKFKTMTSFAQATQPAGSNSCGPWSVIRAKSKDMPPEKFMSYMVKAGSTATNMDTEFDDMEPEFVDTEPEYESEYEPMEPTEMTRRHTQEAFGPIGREAPHMSALKAQHYADFLREHTNLNDAAAKHVAHVINRSVAHVAEVAQESVADLIARLQEALPGLHVSDLFVSEYGGASAADFNDYAKQLKKVRKQPSVASHSLVKHSKATAGAVKPAKAYSKATMAHSKAPKATSKATAGALQTELAIMRQKLANAVAKAEKMMPKTTLVKAGTACAGASKATKKTKGHTKSTLLKVMRK